MASTNQRKRKAARRRFHNRTQHHTGYNEAMHREVFGAMRVPQLTQLAAENEVEVPSRSRKADLIATLLRRRVTVR